jgi:hypothetical protein
MSSGLTVFSGAGNANTPNIENKNNFLFILLLVFLEIRTF